MQFISKKTTHIHTSKPVVMIQNVYGLLFIRGHKREFPFKSRIQTALEVFFDNFSIKIIHQSILLVNQSVNN